MGLLIYNLIIRSYNLLVLFFSSFNPKANSLVSGRKRTFETIKQSLQKDKKIIWFHCASLGEFEQGLPLMESIKSSYPDYRLYVSFFSPSGYEIQKSNTLLDCVFYLPTDTKSNAEKLLHLLNPIAVFFIKYEFWYHYLKACNDRSIRVLSVSTILRPDQVFFKFYGGFYRKMLNRFHHFFVQNNETLELLESIDLTNATLSGDTRFDRVYAISKEHLKLKLIEDFKGKNTLLVLGSTWKTDIDLWINFLNKHSELKYIIAPHNIDETDIRYIEDKIKIRTARYSRAKNNLGDISVLIIDNIGMLSSLYYYADIAYVGGAFSEGLHNILEPATFGKPIIIGKAETNRKYREVVSLLKGGGAFEINNPGDLGKLIHDLLSDQKLFNRAGNASESFVRNNMGSTDIIMDELKGILS
jgi:3-deoxy-D-manno-octulosonic-acid transferase